MNDTGQELTPVQLEREQLHRRRFVRPSMWLQILAVAAMAVLPFVFPGFKVIDVATKIIIFSVVVGSYDIILGYTGIISFAHGLFFGIGAYCLALVIHHFGPAQYYHLVLGFVLAIVLSGILALVIAFLSLRIKAIFFAMITLALAEFGLILAMQWNNLTNGEDGVSFNNLVGIFDVKWNAGTLFGLPIEGRLMTYYVILIISVLLFIGMIRFVRSPLGRTIKSIRDNEQRATALGYKTFRFQTVSIVFGSVIASLGGFMFAMWVRYVNYESAMDIAIMLNILLMVIIGGLGTLYGSIIGAAFVTIIMAYLPDVQQSLKALPKFVQDIGERWLLFVGLLYILIVVFFPQGVVGTARALIARWKTR